MVTPATIGWKYRSSSWRPRKYHGALDGFGVRFEFATSRRGALTSIENTVTKANIAKAATASRMSRCGQTLTLSSWRGSARWMPSGGTMASRRCVSPNLPCAPTWPGTPLLATAAATRAARSSGVSLPPLPGAVRAGAAGLAAAGAAAGAAAAAGEAAVLADAPEVDRQKDGGHKWQREHMQHVPADERGRPDLDRPEKHEADLVPDHRRVAHHRGADRDRPDGELVPGQQVAGERQQQGEQQQHHADHPVELARRLVGAVVEDPGHVQEHREDHQVGGPSVHISHELAEEHRGRQRLHVVVGELLTQAGRWPVEEHQEDAGDGEQDEQEEGQPAQAERVGQLEAVPLHLHRVQVVQHVVHHGQGAVARGVAVAGAIDGARPEDRPPELRLPRPVPHLPRGGGSRRPLQRHEGLLTVGCPPAGRDDPIRSALPCGYVLLAALLSPTRAYHSAPVGQRSMQIPHRTHSLSSITNRACEVCARVVTSWGLSPSFTMSGASM